jgi:hypothetical protein
MWITACPDQAAGSRDRAANVVEMIGENPWLTVFQRGEMIARVWATPDAGSATAAAFVQRGYPSTINAGQYASLGRLIS